MCWHSCPGSGGVTVPGGTESHRGTWPVGTVGWTGVGFREVRGLFQPSGSHGSVLKELLQNAVRLSSRTAHPAVAHPRTAGVALSSQRSTIPPATAAQRAQCNQQKTDS